MFTRIKKDQSIEDASLSQVLRLHFNEFQAWCYQQDHAAPTSATRGKLISALLSSLIAGNVESDDALGAVDMLSAPNLSGHFPGVDTVYQMMTKFVLIGEDDMKAEQTAGYLQKLFERQPCWFMLHELLEHFLVPGSDAGWGSLCALMSTGSRRAALIVRLFFHLLKGEALSKYPDMLGSQIAVAVGFNLSEKSSWIRRSVDHFGSFVTGAFKCDPVPLDHCEMAHDYIELAFTCLALSTPKQTELCLAEFYEGALLRNLDQDSLITFFNTAKGDYWHVQLALLLLKRKFSIGSGPSFRRSPLASHLEVLQTVLKLTESKVDLQRTSDRLQLSAFYCVIKPLFSAALSSFSVGQETRIPWMTTSDLGTVRSLLQPVLSDSSQTWNPYLVPYRTVFEKTEMEVVVIDGGGGEDESTPRITKRKRRCPV